MKKKQIVKEIVEKEIEPFGFKYLKTDGSCQIFVREVNEIKRYYEPDNTVVKQYINIQENNFSNKLTVRLSTDAYGHEVERELEQIKMCSTETWLTYTDEENYKERLKLLTDLIIQYAFDLLAEMSVEEEVIPTKAMAERLFNQYEQLDQAFIEEFHMKASPEQIKDIEEWYQFIKELIIDKSEQPYEDTKELLMKIAAFIGGRACDLLSQKWIFPKHMKVPTVSGRYPYPSISPLNMVVSMWKFKCDENSCYKFESYINSLKQGFLEQN